MTEWGSVNADGNGGANEASTREWMAFLEENNISHLNWSINDVNEGASVLFGNGQGAHNQGGWALNLLSPSGLLSRDINRNWPAVSSDSSGSPIQPNPPAEEPEPIVTPVISLLLSTLIEAENYTSQSGVRSEATSDIGGGENIGLSLIHI